MNDTEFYTLVMVGEDDPVLAWDVMEEVMRERDIAYATVKDAMKSLVKRGFVKVVVPGTGRKRTWLSAAKVTRTPEGIKAMNEEMDLRVDASAVHEREFRDRAKGRRAFRLRGVDIPPDVAWAVTHGVAALVVKVSEE